MAVALEDKISIPQQRFTIDIYIYISHAYLEMLPTTCACSYWPIKKLTYGIIASVARHLTTPPTLKIEIAALPKKILLRWCWCMLPCTKQLPRQKNSKNDDHLRRNETRPCNLVRVPPARQIKCNFHCFNHSHIIAALPSTHISLGGHWPSMLAIRCAMLWNCKVQTHQRMSKTFCPVHRCLLRLWHNPRGLCANAAHRNWPSWFHKENGLQNVPIVFMYWPAPAPVAKTQKTQCRVDIAFCCCRFSFENWHLYTYNQKHEKHNPGTGKVGTWRHLQGPSGQIPKK